MTVAISSPNILTETCSEPHLTRAGKATGLCQRPEARRFTVDGSPALEQHLADLCSATLAGIQTSMPPEKVEGVLLGGGYGRGEGGVLKHTSDGEQPYNDLEFYVLVRGADWLNARRYQAALHQLTAALGLAHDVEFEFKIMSRAALARSPISMFYYDLVMGHRRLLGADNLLAGCEHHRRADQLPLEEATRLLMNRFSGLLFAWQRLRRGLSLRGDADFVGRNLAKVQLALGDAVLTAHGRYHWSCRERHRRLQELAVSAPWRTEVERHHGLGLEFKLHPYRAECSQAELESRFEALRALGLEIWLWLERRRLNRDFDSIRDYAWSSIRKLPGTNAGLNCLRNMRAFGPQSLIDPKLFRHPRERALNALPLLLWTPLSLGVVRRLQKELRTSAASFAEFVGEYYLLWRQFA